MLVSISQNDQAGTFVILLSERVTYTCQKRLLLHPDVIIKKIIIIIILMDMVCIALLFIRNELTALGRVVSFGACCQWALRSVQITRLVTLYPTVQKCIFYSSVSKGHAGSFHVSVLHRTLTWSTRYRTCVRAVLV